MDRPLPKPDSERSLHIHGFTNLLLGMISGYLILLFLSNLKVATLSFPWIAVHGQWALYGVMLIILSYIYPRIQKEDYKTILTKVAILSVYGWMIGGILYHIGLDWVSLIILLSAGLFIACQALCLTLLIRQGERDLVAYSRIIVLPVLMAFSVIATKIVLDADLEQPFVRASRELLDIHYGTIFFGVFLFVSTALLSSKGLRVPDRLRGFIFLLYLVALMRFLPMTFYLQGWPAGLTLGIPFEVSAWLGNLLTLFALFRYRVEPWDTRSLISVYAFSFFVFIFAARLQILFHYLIPEGVPLLPWEETPGSYRALQFLAFSPQAWTVASLLLGGRLNRLSISPITEKLLVFFAILLPLLNTSGRLVAVLKFKPLLFPVIPLPLLLAGPLFIALFLAYILLSVRRWSSPRQNTLSVRNDSELFQNAS